MKQLFHFHENPIPNVLLENIHHVLDDRLNQVQKAMEDKLATMTLADVKNDVALCMKIAVKRCQIRQIGDEVLKNMGKNSSLDILGVTSKRDLNASIDAWYIILSSVEP